MAENSWTKKENNMFKSALVAFSPLLSARFDFIAEQVGKPVAVVKVHYKELVNDLVEAMADELTQAKSQNFKQAKRPKWTKETHEWFLIGLHRFGRNWKRIANLLDCINPMEVEVYAHKFFLWQKSEKKVMKRPRANDPTLEETNVEVKVMQRPRANNLTLMDTNVNSMGRRESFVHPQAQPQQAPIIRPGHHDGASSSKPYYYYNL